MPCGASSALLTRLLRGAKLGIFSVWQCSPRFATQQLLQCPVPAAGLFENLLGAPRLSRRPLWHRGTNRGLHLVEQFLGPVGYVVVFEALRSKPTTEKPAKARAVRLVIESQAPGVVDACVVNSLGRKPSQSASADRLPFMSVQASRVSP